MPRSDDIARSPTSAFGGPEGREGTDEFGLPRGSRKVIGRGGDPKDFRGRGPGGSTPPVVYQPVFASPKYRVDDGSWYKEFANMPSEQVLSLQERLGRAGLLTGKISLGRMRPGDATYDALKNLVVFSNSEGSTWQQSLDYLQKNPYVDIDKIGGGGGRGERPEQKKKLTFLQPEYRSPDYESLEAGVRKNFHQLMDRQPEQWELALFGKMLSDSYHQRYHSEVDKERRRFDKLKPLVEGHEDKDHVHDVFEAQLSEEAEGASLPDPWDRWYNYVQENYGEAIEWVQDRDRVQSTMQTLMAGLSGMANMIGG